MKAEMILEILNQWDPVELYPGTAAPRDEYALEARMITTSLDSDPVKLALSIFDVFTRTLGDTFHCRLDECMIVACRILERLKRENG